MVAEKVGVLRPLRVTAHGDLGTGSGEDLRKSHLRGIMGMMGTSAGILGELEWDHARGNKLEALRNAAMGPALVETALFHCGATIAEFMPTERLVGFYASVAPEDRTIVIELETRAASDRSVVPRTIATEIRVGRTTPLKR